jgi:hypothetical protein
MISKMVMALRRVEFLVISSSSMNSEWIRFCHRIRVTGPFRYQDVIALGAAASMKCSRLVGVVSWEDRWCWIGLDLLDWWT